MRLYLDDDVVARMLVRFLRQAGHDVVIPEEAGTVGSADAVHLTIAIRDQCVLLTGNHDDFEDLHCLIRESQGHHAGIVVVRSDNDPRRDMTPRGIATALTNLATSRLELADRFHIANHWR